MLNVLGSLSMYTRASTFVSWYRHLRSGTTASYALKTIISVTRSVRLTKRSVLALEYNHGRVVQAPVG